MIRDGSQKERVGTGSGRPLWVHLAWLVVGVMVPLVAFSVLVVDRLAQSRREVEEKRLSRTAVGMAATLDREFEGSIRILQSLAEMPPIQQGDFDAFRELANRVLASQPSWISIAVLEPSGQLLMNTALPPDRPLPMAREMESVARIAREARPVVGKLTRARGPEVRAFPVRVPVKVNGEFKYVLTATLSPDALRSLVAPDRATEGEWSRTIVDSGYIVVARTRDPQRFIGQPASSEFIENTKGNREGIIRATTLDGLQGCSGYAKSELADWTCVVIAPSELVDGPVQQSVMMTTAVGGILLLVSLAVAIVFSRSISRSIASATRGAELLARGATPEIRPAGVTEVQQLADALTRSADLLQRRELERSDLLIRAEAARQEAEAASRSKDEFLAMLGHELRNPLSPTRHGISFLDRQIPANDTVLRPVVEVLDRQVVHMTRLVNDLLDASRISRGTIELQRQRLDLVTVARDVTTDHLPEFKLQNRELVFVATAEPLHVTGDRTRLSQCLTNLLHNALKFTRQGGRVEVHVFASGADAVLSVRDNGIGIDAELLPRLFSVFGQGPQQLSRSLGGLGLGLNLVRGLIELHGGRVEVRSEGVNRGATFDVILPIEVASEGDSFASEAASHVATPFPRRRVLLVEDMADTARMLRLILSHEGHDVRIAGSGSEALAAVHSFTPDVILCDIGLPDMDGFELCQQLRNFERFRETFIVALTGYGQQDDVRKSLQAGFSLHITKPVDTATLKRIVAQGAMHDVSVSTHI